ncbi:hypothetical protein [Chryseobacterium sp. CCH4-E10]|uniref:hypothetical protein n=1 Tax=Chryseobacterium sp. CCH4-E10 TaxID=1768758 RepID=UPI00082DA747|nr:hypothetical protein [Chryseobacterium sp. CCH4-E10]
MNKKLTEKKISIKKLNRVYGGATWRNTNNGTTTNSSGCTVTKSDLYLDEDDDGKMNNNDWKSLQVCESIQCP